MRSSVLLPTRNGGKFLRNCIESILSQDHDDFELVVSDNANSDETPAVLRDYAGHPRVTVIRLDEPVPVTDNWNAAYRASTGDYILMMGDDDYLLPDYFRRMDAILDRYGGPDCVLYNAYSYAAPGSIAGHEQSFFSARLFNFGPDLQSEQELAARHKRSIVHDMFRWKPRIPLNMQTALVARRAAERIAGGFFQPPFPDHYALNVLLLSEVRWIFTPERMVVVGVSPKSFGHYAFSGQHTAGLDYLGIAPEFPGLLPGSSILNGTHVWLNRLRANFPNELVGIDVDRAGYVRRQVHHWLLERRFASLRTGDLLQRLGLLSWKDWLGLVSVIFDRESWRQLYSRRSQILGSKRTAWHAMRALEGVADIAEFGRWIEANPQRSSRG
jgi:glycosyltransferase involved in cell wall biosynthesis